MSRKPGIVGTVESVATPTVGAHVEDFTGAESTAASTTFTLRGKEKSFEIPPDRYSDLYTKIVNLRKDKPIYVETEDDAEQVVSRILIPQLRRVVETRFGPFHVEVRAQGSPLKLIMSHKLFNEHEDRLKDSAQELLITHDPDTHIVLDVSDPFDVPKGGAPLEPPRADAEPLSLKKAEEEFGLLADAPEIPFNFPDEFCNARAHQMFRLLRDRQITCEKIWNFGSEGEQLNSRILVYTLNHPDGRVAWCFHVAVLVKVRLPNQTVVDMVFDPALVERPIRIPDWVALQHDSTAVQERTRPEIFAQEVGGKNPVHDDDFKETDASLEVARAQGLKRQRE